MFSRRQFLLAAANCALAGSIPVSFFEKAKAYLEINDSPLLIPPETTQHVLYAVLGECGEHSLFLNNPKLEPPELTWREFMVHYFGSVEEYLDVDNLAEAKRVFNYDLDSEADFDFILECWLPQESPEAQAFKLLKSLDLGRQQLHKDFLAEFEFIEGPMPGSNYRAVHCYDPIALSYLQYELNRKGQPIEIKLVED